MERGGSTQILLGSAGDLLPDWYEDWVHFKREQLRQVRLHALEALCARLTGVGRHATAVQAGLAAVECEPLRESAHRALIRAYVAEGNQGEALRQYVYDQLVGTNGSPTTVTTKHGVATFTGTPNLDAQVKSETMVAFNLINHRWVDYRGSLDCAVDTYLRRRNLDRIPWKAGHRSDAPTPAGVTDGLGGAESYYTYTHTLGRTIPNRPSQVRLPPSGPMP